MNKYKKSILLSFIFVLGIICICIGSSYSLFKIDKKGEIHNKVITGTTEEVCEYENGYVWNFDYTGGEQEFTVPCNGTYKLETWGAQGGNNYKGTQGGLGGYSSGMINLDKEYELYIYVGGKGITMLADEDLGGSGGGGTDIRTSSSLYSRLIVAGGGGGASQCICSSNAEILKNRVSYGGYGGGLTAGNGDFNYKDNPSYKQYGTGATISGPGSFVGNYGDLYAGLNGVFGAASNSNDSKFNIYTGGYNGGGSSSCEAGGGGGGWYGGGTADCNAAGGGGGGGSGYVYSSDLAKYYPAGCLLDSSLYMNNYQIKAGNEVIPSHDGQSTMIGNTGNGYARITLVSLD